MTQRPAILLILTLLCILVTTREQCWWTWKNSNNSRKWLVKTRMNLAQRNYWRSRKSTKRTKGERAFFSSTSLPQTLINGKRSWMKFWKKTRCSSLELVLDPQTDTSRSLNLFEIQTMKLSVFPRWKICNCPSTNPLKWRKQAQYQNFDLHLTRMLRKFKLKMKRDFKSFSNCFTQNEKNNKIK